MERYEKYLEYVVSELVKIDTEYSNTILEKVRSLDPNDSNRIVYLVSSTNSICSSKIELYWLWCKKKRR